MKTSTFRADNTKLCSLEKKLIAGGKLITISPSRASSAYVWMEIVNYESSGELLTCGLGSRVFITEAGSKPCCTWERELRIIIDVPFSIHWINSSMQLNLHLRRLKLDSIYILLGVVYFALRSLSLISRWMQCLFACV